MLCATPRRGTTHISSDLYRIIPIPIYTMYISRDFEKNIIQIFVYLAYFLYLCSEFECILAKYA